MFLSQVESFVLFEVFQVDISQFKVVSKQVKTTVAVLAFLDQ